jgi:type IV pilus assembly protein PilB
MPNQKPTSNRKEQELDKKLLDIKGRRDEEEYRNLAIKSNLAFTDLKTIPVDGDALTLLDEDTSRNAKVAVIYKSGSKLTIVCIDPKDKETTAIIKNLKDRGFVVELMITTPEMLESVWKRYAVSKHQDTFEVGAIDLKESELIALQNQIKDISDLKIKVAQISVTKVLEFIIAGALKMLASDIHLETEAESTRLRYRLDGILNDITTIDKNTYEKLLNRLKVLSKMKLNIHGSPQDGRFTIKQSGVDIEVRTSVLPSEFGETIVMRLLDPRTIKNSLEELGMRSDLLEIVKAQLARSTGAILTTGPTGSGKTTSLYAFISFLNSAGNKIVTIEDPIEYHIKGISQTQVDNIKGYTFANGLRAIVRQDPDIILVGEIRDFETSEIALHAALTGHLVLSTIHTNNAAGTIPRLIDLGIKGQIIAPAINMAMGQRLVRRLCENCKVKKPIPVDTLEKLKKTMEPLREKFKLPEFRPSLELYFSKKCDQCNNTGYKGRVGVFEAFVISKEMERLILKNPAISDIEDLAIKEGMITMLQDAYLKMLEGLTSVEEVDRILG